MSDVALLVAFEAKRFTWGLINQGREGPRAAPLTPLKRRTIVYSSPVNALLSKPRLRGLVMKNQHGDDQNTKLEASKQKSTNQRGTSR